MRSAPARRKKGISFSEIARPAVTIICILLAVRITMSAVSTRSGGLSDVWGSGGVEAALGMALGGRSGEAFSPVSLIRMSSSAFGAGPAPSVAVSPPIVPTPPPSLTPPAQIIVPPSETPVTTPLVSPFDPFAVSPTPETALPSPSGEQLDDRVWATPMPDDPSAKQLREVTLLPSTAATTASYGEVYINNDTGYSIDIADMLSKKPALKKSATEPQILIIHTHGSESFLPDERDMYVPTDIERTEDTRYNVVRLGDEMTELLSGLGLNVLHDRTIHDYPTYSGSYSHALKSIEDYVKQYPSIQMVIDIHRDAIISSDGTMYKTVAQTELGKAAQMMLVMGSNKNGLPFDGWRNNLTFAVGLQKSIVDSCPTLMRPVSLRPGRYNEHATNGSILLEVGTAGNSLSEALLSVRLFCKYAGPYIVQTLIP